MKKEPKDMSDDELLDEFVQWCRISRNEKILPAQDRIRLRGLTLEIKKRKLLEKHL